MTRRVGGGLAALLLALCGLAMATAVDRGFTRGWPGYARLAWAATILAVVAGGLMVAGVSVGRFSPQRFQAIGSHTVRTPTVGQFVAVYVGSMAFGLGLALVLEARYEVPGAQTVLVYCGAAALGIAAGFVHD